MERPHLIPVASQEKCGLSGNMARDVGQYARNPEGVIVRQRNDAVDGVGAINP